MASTNGTHNDHPHLDPATQARFQALSADERTRVCRLVAVSGCTIAQAVAAVEATRPAQPASRNPFRKAHR
ncbi:MAG TPA: hypothetical protein PKD53_33610 [Chloroflexaceae bacterium]|nr:hypothetical protein [Chloroflexaceae bacterium]